MKLHILVGNRSERMPRLMKELSEQNITDYELWEGVFKYKFPKENINAAHKQIVEYAKLAEWEIVVIAEDDVKFFAPGAWDFFLKNMPKDFDLYLSSIYMGEIQPDNTVHNFCGMGLYACHSRFYDTFLETDPHDHIDRSLAGKGRFVVCNPFVAEQYDGHSSNTGKDEVYGHLLEGKKKFGM